MRMPVSKRPLAVYSLLLLVLLAFLIVSRKYIWLYATRKLAPEPASADLLRDSKSSQNPEVLLAEANPSLGFSIGPRPNLFMSVRKNCSEKKTRVA